MSARRPAPGDVVRHECGLVDVVVDTCSTLGPLVVVTAGGRTVDASEVEVLPDSAMAHVVLAWMVDEAQRAVDIAVLRRGAGAALRKRIWDASTGRGRVGMGAGRPPPHPARAPPL